MGPARSGRAAASTGLVASREARRARRPACRRTRGCRAAPGVSRGGTEPTGSGPLLRLRSRDVRTLSGNVLAPLGRRCCRRLGILVRQEASDVPATGALRSARSGLYGDAGGPVRTPNGLGPRGKRPKRGEVWRRHPCLDGSVRLTLDLFRVSSLEGPRVARGADPPEDHTCRSPQ